MDSALIERLNILQIAGETTEDITEAIKDFSQKFKEIFKIELVEANSSMLITHLAMALARVQKGEPINEVDKMVSDEVRNNEHFEQLKELFELLEDKLKLILPESEKDYIALHACTIIMNDSKL
ncbi:PRD domain-containing protein [Clostridiaceae bacterium M8S5]|nr:PRD domain-containing protein [Clostridiaceae bacterium M8S5]